MQAMAAHNSGGLVIVQVERVVERGCIPARSVHLPGALVDKVTCCKWVMPVLQRVHKGLCSICLARIITQQPCPAGLHGIFR